MLRIATIALALSSLLPASPCKADDPYHEQLNAYKSEISRDVPDLTNSGFFSTIAISQAKRAVNGVRDDLGGVVVDNAETSTASANARTNGGGVNVASPRIFGNVRGNVNIVVEKNAVRGNITSVRR